MENTKCLELSKRFVRRHLFFSVFKIHFIMSFAINSIDMHKVWRITIQLYDLVFANHCHSCHLAYRSRMHRSTNKPHRSTLLCWKEEKVSTYPFLSRILLVHCELLKSTKKTRQFSFFFSHFLFEFICDRF